MINNWFVTIIGLISTLYKFIITIEEGNAIVIFITF